MKIAIAKMGENVCDHFGHCDHFDIYSVEGTKLYGKETVKCPAHEPCKLPSHLRQMGIDVIIAGGMGARAVSQLDELGIDAYLGVSGPADWAIAKFMEGKLMRGRSTCSGGEGHDCGH